MYSFLKNHKLREFNNNRNSSIFILLYLLTLLISTLLIYTLYLLLNNPEFLSFLKWKVAIIVWCKVMLSDDNVFI